MHSYIYKINIIWRIRLGTRTLDLNKLITKVPHRVSIDPHLALRIAITHKLESVVRSVLKVIVFPTDVLEKLEEMKPAARIYGRDRTMCLAILEPGPANYDLVNTRS
jgi:hypothetical protein